MPNIVSAKKRLRQNVKRRLRNRSAKSAIHTMGKKVLSAIGKNDKDLALKLFNEYSSLLDRAGRKSIIHSNRSAAKKSNMMKKINAIG